MYDGFFYNDAKVDYSITRKLGTASGSSTAINGDPYFRIRTFVEDGNGGQGGVAVVNANTTKSQTYTVVGNCTDENGAAYTAGAKITLLPNMGKILYYTSANVSISLTTSPSSAVSGQQVTVTISYTNTGGVAANNLVVQTVVPNELTYVAGSAENGGGTYNSGTKTVSWTIASLAAHASGTRTFTARTK